jgi:purine-nucleoside phosphorylase
MSKVEDFLSQYSSTTTVKNYKTALRHYFKIFYANLGLVEAVEEYFKTPKTEAEYENLFHKVLYYNQRQTTNYNKRTNLNSQTISAGERHRVL